MSEHPLIKKIIADSEVQIAQLNADADAELAMIASDAETKISNARSAAAAQLEKEKQQLLLVAKSKAKQTSNIALQTAKRKQIDLVFSEVFKDLTQQSDSDYIAFFTKHALALLPKKVEAIKVEAPENRLSETAKILEAAGVKTVPVPGKVTAGFIVHTNDGVYDVSFDRLFTEKRAELEMAIVGKIN